MSFNRERALSFRFLRIPFFLLLSFGGQIWAQSSTSFHPWPIQDGSFVIEQVDGAPQLVFPFVPFLELDPVWMPSLPAHWNQPAQEVQPVPGLGGSLRMGWVDDDDQFHPLFNPLEAQISRTPYSATCSLAGGDPVGLLKWICPLGEKSVVFRLLSKSIGHVKELRFEIRSFNPRLIWATPGKKERHDWGVPVFEWDDANNVLIQTYETPVDATRSPTTALWIDRDLNVTFRMGAERNSYVLDLGSSESCDFGFSHADNRKELFESVEELRTLDDPFRSTEGEWAEWLANSDDQIKKHLKKDRLFEAAEADQKRIFDQNLIQTRQLFLSNGVMLNRAMTMREIPLSMMGQGIALRCWTEMGLPFPYLERLRDLTLNHPLAERSLPIPLLSGKRIRDVLGKGNVTVLSPDPGDPPTKTVFDALLGYVINGGNLTLVDGISGFADKEGWWKESGAADIADYAIRMLDAPVDPDSRSVLHAEGLSPHVNTFVIHSRDLGQGHSTSFESVRISSPGGGNLILFPSSSADEQGVRIRGGKIGETEFLPFTSSEDEIISASYELLQSRSADGFPDGRLLLGEGFVAYRLPEGGTVTCELELSGDWKAAWSEKPPQSNLTLLKKAYQVWYRTELLQVPVSKAAHPVVYEGTYTCRVFDVSGTTTSPVLYHRIGRGTFVWVGLPRDFILLGSDRGTDAQRSLREDPFYDLIRMTLALHDPKQGGSLAASQSPEIGWTERWNTRNENSFNPDMTYHAWELIRRSGMEAEGKPFWTNVVAEFHQVLTRPDRCGRLLSGTNLTISEKSSATYVGLATNLRAYAVYQDLIEVAQSLGLTWWSNVLSARAADIEEDLTELLGLKGENPLAGRRILDGTVAQEIPYQETLPNLLWAVSEIRGRRFPGGDDVRNRVLERTVTAAKSSKDPHVIGALAVLEEASREEHLESILPDGKSSDLLLIGNDNDVYDLVTAAQVLQALALE